MPMHTSEAEPTTVTQATRYMRINVSFVLLVLILEYFGCLSEKYLWVQLRNAIYTHTASGWKLTSHPNASWWWTCALVVVILCILALGVVALLPYLVGNIINARQSLKVARKAQPGYTTEQDVAKTAWASPSTLSVN